MIDPIGQAQQAFQALKQRINPPLLSPVATPAPVAQPQAPQFNPYDHVIQMAQQFAGSALQAASKLSVPGQLFGQGGGLSTPNVQQTQQQVGKMQQSQNPVVSTVGNVVKPAVNYAQNFITNPINQAPAQIQQGAQQTFRPGVGASGLPNSVAGPVKVGLGVLGAVGGAFSATGAGVGFNALQSGIAGTMRGVRTNQGILPSVGQALQEPTGIVSQGLGVTNPFIAGLGDFAAGAALGHVTGAFGGAENIAKEGINTVRGGVEDAINLKQNTLEQMALNEQRAYQALGVQTRDEVGQYGNKLKGISFVGGPPAELDPNQVPRFSVTMGSKTYYLTPLEALKNGISAKELTPFNAPAQQAWNFASQRGSFDPTFGLGSKDNVDQYTPGKPDPSLVASAKGIGTSDVPLAPKSSLPGAIDEVKNAFGTGANTQDLQNSLRDNRGHFDLAKDQLTRDSQPMVKAWDKLDPKDQVQFIQNVQSGTPQPNPQLEQLAQQYHARFDQDYELAKQLKPDLPYMQNYFAQSGVWADPKAADAFAQKFMQPSLGGKPGALEQRVFPTIQDGIAAGLKLKETNPETIALTSRTQLLKAKMAQDFTDQQLAKGVPQPQIDAVLDKYLGKGLEGSQVFQTVRQANAALNSLQLGLSGFHVAGTAINASVSKGAMAIQDLTSGHPLDALKHVAQTPTATLEYLMKGNQILKDVSSNTMSPDIENIAGGGGRLRTPDIYQGVGFQDALKNMHADNWGTKLKGAMQTIPATVETVAKPVMEWWVPRLKAGAAADLIANNLKRLPEGATPEQINAVRSAAIDAIDNRFGQLNGDNLFWNKTLKDLMSLGMRSPGWNIGTVRELGGGVADLLPTKGNMGKLLAGQGISNRSAYAMALPVVVGMMGAAYQYIKTGQGPQSVKDYFYPQTGQTEKTGQPERVSFPTYMKDVYGIMTNPTQTLANKASPILNEVSQQVQNKDFYGQNIANPNAPLPLQVAQRGLHALGAVTPFSVSSSTNRINPSVDSTAESFMGVTKAPQSISNPGKINSGQQFSTHPYSDHITSTDAPKNIIEKLDLFAKAATTDPQNAIKAIFAGETMRKMNGNALVFERKNGINPGGSGLIADHIVPIEIGGDNSNANLQYSTPADAALKDKLENQLASGLANGTISVDDARKQAQAYQHAHPGIPYDVYNKANPQQPKVILDQNYNPVSLSTKQQQTLQQTGADPSKYAQSLVDTRTQNAQSKTAGTDKASQQEAATIAWLNGDPSQAQKIGMTIGAVKAHITSQMNKAAMATVTGDPSAEQTFTQTYKRPIAPIAFRNAAHKQAMTLMQTALGLQQQGDSQGFSTALQQVKDLQQKYQFVFTSKDNASLFPGGQ